MADTQYNIIREQGEFFDPKPLTDEENETVLKEQKEDKNTD
jgi:hypothetical protein